MKHFALWGAWYGSRNVGDQALLLSIANILKKEFGEVRITVFTNDAAHVARYGPAESGCDVVAVENRRQFHKVVATLVRCDLFIIGGGVPFYGQAYHLGVITTLVGLARLFGTPYMTWSVATQNVPGRTAQRVLAGILQKARLVTYRDPVTAEIFRSWGVNREMVWAADPVFRFVDFADHDPEGVLRQAGWDGERRLAAILCRKLGGRSSFADEHYNTKQATTIETAHRCFAAAIDWAWENGYRPLLLPMNTVAPDDDRDAARQAQALARHGERALLIDREVRPAMVAAILRRCALAFSGRLHGLVLSMLAGCPMLAYAYGPKMVGIMATMDMSDYVLVDETATPDEIVARLAALDAGAEELRKRIGERLLTLQEHALLPATLARPLLQDRAARTTIVQSAPPEFRSEEVRRSE